MKLEYTDGKKKLYKKLRHDRLGVLIQKEVLARQNQIF